MNRLTIRRVPDETIAALKAKAEREGTSVAKQVRFLLLLSLSIPVISRLVLPSRPSASSTAASISTSDAIRRQPALSISAVADRLSASLDDRLREH